MTMHIHYRAINNVTLKFLHELHMQKPLRTYTTNKI